MRFHAELHPLVCLKNFDDLQNVVRTWIATRSQHAVNALVSLFELLCQLLESDGRVDVVTEHGLARIEVSCQQFVHGLDQHLSSECRIAYCTVQDGCSEFSRNGHVATSLQESLGSLPLTFTNSDESQNLEATK